MLGRTKQKEDTDELVVESRRALKVLTEYLESLEQFIDRLSEQETKPA